VTCRSERSEESPRKLSLSAQFPGDSHLHCVPAQVSLPSVVQNDIMFLMLDTPAKHIIPSLFQSAQNQCFMDCEAESAYLLSKKITTATMTRYTNSGLVYVFILASTQHNELREVQLFHHSLILSQYSA